MKRLLPTLLLFLFLWPFVVRAGQNPSAGLDRFLSEVRQKSATFHSLTCRFTQERHLSLFKEPVIFHGTMALVRPDRLRWQLLDPIPSVVVFHGDSGLRCTDKEAPVRFDLASDPLMHMIAEQLRTWLNGDYGKLAETSSLSLDGPSTLVIIPREKLASSIKSITISFTGAERQPQRVEITEAGGDRTIIRFTDYSFNAALPDAVFTRCDGND